MKYPWKCFVSPARTRSSVVRFIVSGQRAFKAPNAAWKRTISINRVSKKLHIFKVREFLTLPCFEEER